MKLRDQIRISIDRGSSGQKVLVLMDDLTRRSFAVPEAASALLEALRTARTMDEIVAACGEEYDEESIESFVEDLRAKLLLDEGLPAETIREKARTLHGDTTWSAMHGLLNRAKRHIPFYKKKLEDLDLSAISGPSDLLKVPVTIKKDLRAEYPDGFIPDTVQLQELTLAGAIERGVTSGTSAGERVQTLHTREVMRKQMIAGATLNALVQSRLESRSARFTSMHCADPNVCVTQLPSMHARVREGLLLLLPPEDPGAPTVAEVNKLLHEIRAHEVTWIDCNPTYMAMVTYVMKDAGIAPPKIEVMTTGWEFQSAIHRRVLSEFWGVKVFDRFGASELGNYLALECEHGGLHFNDLFYCTELVREGRHAAPGEVGRLVVSTLQEKLALVRYDTRDLMVAAAPGPCPCGSLNRRVAAFAGRVSDIMLTPRGEVRTERDIDQALAATGGIRGYQVSQSSPTQYQANIIPEPSLDAGRARARSAEALHQVLGPGAEIRVDAVRRIYPEASGKFRLTRSALENIESKLPA